jgi:hypothetical protein
MSDLSLNMSNESPTNLTGQNPFDAPPLSPGTAETAMQLAQGDHEIVIQIAKGLISTLRRRAEETRQEREQKDLRIRDLEQIVEGSAPRSSPPEGYVKNTNYRAPFFTIPIQDGYSQPAYWVQKAPDGRVAGLPEIWSENDQPYIGEIYAPPFDATQNNHEDTDDRDPYPEHADPTLPLPPWLHELLKGPAVQFDKLRKEVDEHENWGVQAEIRRFREMELFIIDTQRRLDLLHAELRGARQAQEASQGRLELAKLDKTMSHLRTLPNMGKRGFGEYRQQSRKFSRQ